MNIFDALQRVKDGADAKWQNQPRDKAGFLLPFPAGYYDCWNLGLVHHGEDGWLCLTEEGEVYLEALTP